MKKMSKGRLFHEKVVKTRTFSLKSNNSDGFFLDLRSLALFRIGIGVVLIVNLMVRLTMPNYLPIQGGILPSELMSFGGSCPWSFHFFWHSFWFQYLLIGLNLLLCFCYLLGHRMRYTAPLVFLFTLSINYSNCWSLNSGDVQLVLVLLLSCFLPMSSFWSLDQILAAGSLPLNFDWVSRKSIVVSIASAAFVLQVILIYWMAVSEFWLNVKIWPSTLVPKTVFIIEIRWNVRTGRWPGVSCSRNRLFWGLE